MISLTNMKDITAIVQSLFTVLAIVIGGIWTYLLFVRTRQRYPRLKITHQISHWAVNHEKAVLSLSVVISNIGNVLISIEPGTIEISQPPAEDELSNIPVGRHVVIWPEIIRFKTSDLEQLVYELEPDEDQQFFYHIIIDAQATMILVKTLFPNIEKRRKKFSWGFSTIYYLQSSNQDSSKSKLTTENAQI